MQKITQQNLYISQTMISGTPNFNPNVSYHFIAYVADELYYVYKFPTLLIKFPFMQAIIFAAFAVINIMVLFQ